MEVNDREALRKNHLEWIGEKLKDGNPFREDQWTESIAVGGEAFVKEIQGNLGAKAIGRVIVADEDRHQLREVQQPYMAHFTPEKVCLKPKNSLKWNVFDDISIG